MWKPPEVREGVIFNMKKKTRFKGIGGRKDKKWKAELKKPIPLNLMKWKKEVLKAVSKASGFPVYMLQGKPCPQKNPKKQ